MSFVRGGVYFEKLLYNIFSTVRNKQVVCAFNIVLFSGGAAYQSKES